ncbi:arginine--tRNA ligase [Streptococcus sp. DD12]|uniref:arginine--tRNA ligase n=1 Tax=Streptococcus sp. DD12 TaxID=1777880 RepID=UPI0007974B9C|nr:arginine--tRNA ligase [Streptococcus sp. DD12]KXT76075.1 Arginyl-tRNA synthetase [Streptococcus sp. DD12]
MDNKRYIAQALDKIIDPLDEETIYELIETPKKSELGDFAFPTFTLARTFRKAPQAIAQELAETIDNTGFEKVEAVGPYLNFFLDKSSITKQVLETVITEKDHYGQQAIGKDKSVVIDMSSPNIAKPFSIGHLRSTVIGDSLSLLFQKLGYTTVKINHLGDWGKQFGLLIVAYKKWGDEATVKANPITELAKLYVRVNAEAKEDPRIDEEARQWFRKLENGDAEALQLWQWFRDESLEEFNRIYQILDVTFDSYNGEAFYNDKMDAVVALLEEKGLLQESEGAQVVNLESYGITPPALIKKSDGATLYITRDLAAALYRKNTYHFDKALYVVGGEQEGHFRQLKAVLTEMGYSWSDDVQQVAFGLVTKNGKKLSTRKGNVILLEPTITEAIERALQQIDAKNPDLKNKEDIARQVGVGAIKFYDLKTDRKNGYDFDLEAMVSFEGETGPYVQYTHARIQSILRKANYVPSSDLTTVPDGEQAWELTKQLQNFPKIIERAADQYEPSIMAKYAIRLAQSFNKYYAQTRILNEDDQKSGRLALAFATATVIKEALALLGVQAPDEM